MEAVASPHVVNKSYSGVKCMVGYQLYTQWQLYSHGEFTAMVFVSPNLLKLHFQFTYKNFLRNMTPCNF